MSSGSSIVTCIGPFPNFIMRWPRRRPPVRSSGRVKFQTAPNPRGSLLRFLTPRRGAGTGAGPAPLRQVFDLPRRDSSRRACLCREPLREQRRWWPCDKSWPVLRDWRGTQGACRRATRWETRWSEGRN
jgi:hypothetical protein